VVCTKSRSFLPYRYDGTLGVGFFERFSVTFDFAGRAMYLLPNKRISERQPFDASGIVFRKNATSYEVDFVLPDSPGSRADVRESDRLLQLDGRPVDRLTLLELRDLMSHNGETRELRLARGNQILNVSLLLRERL
jgi:C-terminal processing protease CtpA/Prc